MYTRKATINDIGFIVPLFDGYRQFYKQSSDLEGARSFITRRLSSKESIIFLAFESVDSSQAIGFTQLYPVFSSVSMERMLLLNDLYIHPEHRGKGVGTLLIDCVKDLCRLDKQKGVVIQTATTNPAQKLYERLGFIKDPDLHYFWPC